MTRPAVTSKRVAHIAARVLRLIDDDTFLSAILFGQLSRRDLITLAASALRQTEQASTRDTPRLIHRAPATAKKAGIKPKRGKWTARKVALRKAREKNHEWDSK